MDPGGISVKIGSQKISSSYNRSKTIDFVTIVGCNENGIFHIRCIYKVTIQKFFIYLKRKDRVCYILGDSDILITITRHQKKIPY